MPRDIKLSKEYSKLRAEEFDQTSSIYEVSGKAIIILWTWMYLWTIRLIVGLENDFTIPPANNILIYNVTTLKEKANTLKVSMMPHNGAIVLMASWLINRKDTITTWLSL